MKKIDYLCKTTLWLSLSYLLYAHLQIETGIALLLFVGSLVGYIAIRWVQYKNKGFCEWYPKLKSLLFQKSILDIFADIIYFPYITKIIATFFKVAILKPHPKNLQQEFNQLQSSTKQFITKKGLLSLTPKAIESIIVSKDKKQVPPEYGMPTWRWIHELEYQKNQFKAHELTIEKQMVTKLKSVFSCSSTVLLITAFCICAKLMKKRQRNAMMIQGGTIILFLLSSIAVLVNVKKK